MQPLLLLPKTVLALSVLACLAGMAGCSKSPSSKSQGPTAETASKDMMRQTSSSGSTTRDTSSACKGSSASGKNSGKSDTGIKLVEDYLDDGDGLGFLDRNKDPQSSSRSGDGISGSLDTDAQSLVDRLCARCHGLEAELGNRNKSGLTFGGKEDLLIRADDIIKEFENPGRQHRSIRDPQVVVDAFEQFKEDAKKSQDKTDKSRDSCS